ncbi:MAG: hypothetical protein P8J14_04335 [Emcibacteraceae bacterium]|nr:hypothetical protein [Emcibacteraceae bacterium]
MLSNLALIAEIIGAIAIIITLAFVGYELKENTKSTKSATASAVAASTSAWYSELGDNEQSSSLFLHFMQNPDALTPELRFQASMKVHGMLVVLQNSYYLMCEGTLDKGILTYISGAILSVHNQPGWKWYWEQRKGMFYKEFQDYIDGLGTDGVLYSQGFFQQSELYTTKSE